MKLFLLVILVLSSFAQAASLSISQAVFDEKEQQYIGKIEYKLSNPLDEDVIFNVTITNGSATGDDYQAPDSQSLTIPAGQTSVLQDVTIYPDDEHEEQYEIFNIVIDTLVQGELDNYQRSSQAMIYDNDKYKVSLDFEPTVNEEDELHTITVKVNPVESEVIRDLMQLKISILYTHPQSTIQYDEDITPITESIIISKGEMGPWEFQFQIEADEIPEDPENVVFGIEGSNDIEIAYNQLNLMTIADDDSYLFEYFSEIKIDDQNYATVSGQYKLPVKRVDKNTGDIFFFLEDFEMKYDLVSPMRQLGQLVMPIFSIFDLVINKDEVIKHFSYSFAKLPGIRMNIPGMPPIPFPGGGGQIPPGGSPVPPGGGFPNPGGNSNVMSPIFSLYHMFHSNEIDMQTGKYVVKDWTFRDYIGFDKPYRNTMTVPEGSVTENTSFKITFTK